MNKKLVFLVMLVSLLALSLAFVSCDNGTTSGGGGGGEWWEGHYVANDGATLDLNTSTLTITDDDGKTTHNGVYTVQGGDIMYNGADIGDWIYIIANINNDPNRFGIIVKVETDEPGTYIGIGGARDDLVKAITDRGGTFDPAANMTVVSGYFYGTKQ
jgi:hypothetical protein